MADAGTNLLIQHLRTALSPRHETETDGQLLARWAADRDAQAFAALVRRHGPMVLAVCRSVLRHLQVAKTARQADIGDNNAQRAPFGERDGFPTSRCGLDMKSGIGQQRADRVAHIIIVLTDEDGRAFSWLAISVAIWPGTEARPNKRVSR